MKKLPPTERLRALEAAARLESFKLAGEELAVTASAISHRVRALETELGVALFKRTGTGVVPTEAGARLSKSVANGLALIQSTWSDLAKEISGRPIRISCAPMFASRFLLPRLDAFHAGRSNASLEIASTNDLADIEQGGCDIGIRMVRRPQRTLFSERLMPVYVVPVCAKNARRKWVYRNRIRGNLLGTTYLPDAWDTYARLGLMDIDQNATTLWFDSLEAIYSAAQSGAGVALVPDWLIDGVSNTDRACSVLSEPAPSGFSYWMTMRRGEEDSAALTAVRQWVKAGVDAMHTTYQPA